MPVTYEDILNEVRRQEAENAQSIGQGPSFGPGATLGGLGDIFSGIAEFGLAKKRKDLEKKAMESAQSYENYELDRRTYETKKNKIDLEDIQGNEALNRIRYAHTRAKASGDKSILSTISDDDERLSQTIRDPATGAFKSFIDINPDLANEIKKYPKYVGEFQDEGQLPWSQRDNADFLKKWHGAIEYEQRIEKDLHNASRKGSGRSSALSALSALTKDAASIQGKMDKIDQNMLLENDEKEKRKKALIEDLKVGTGKRARILFESIGDTESLKKLDNLEKMLDGISSSPNIGAAVKQSGSIFDSLTNMFVNSYSRLSKEQGVDASTYPGNASDNKTTTPPVIPAAPGLSGQNISPKKEMKKSSGKIKVTNGKEIRIIDESDLKDAQKDGYRKAS